MRVVCEGFIDGVEEVESPVHSYGPYSVFTVLVERCNNSSA